MKKLWIIGILITGLLTTSANCFAQDALADYAGFRDLGITSPTAAGLGKYGSIPVDLSTGIPNINIPLAEISAGKLKVPISLSYHASGIKVTEYPGPVGLGWSLNTGGVITRVVKGFPDEVNSGGYSGFFYEQENIDKVFLGISQGGFTDQEEAEYLLDIARNKIDTEADVFFYNFAGKSGFFTLDGDGGFTSFPDVNIKIEYDSTLTSFTLFTDDGTKYIFDFTEQAQQLAPSEADAGGFLGSYNPFEGYYNSAWYVTSIEHPSQSQKIVMEYDSVSSNVIQETLSASFVSRKYGGSLCPDGNTISSGNYSRQKTIDNARITKISVSTPGTNKTINFNYENDSNNEPLFFRLKDIDIKFASILDKQISFTYGTHSGTEGLLVSNQGLKPCTFSAEL